MRITFLMLFICPFLCAKGQAQPGKFQRLEYRNPGLVVDLGVGLWAWPLPMDYDNDGDLDLVVSCPDVPYNGTYFFENPGGQEKMPIFKPAVRIDRGYRNICTSHLDEKVRLLIPGFELSTDRKSFGQRKRIYPKQKVHRSQGRIRANQWKYADYDSDGALDLVVGIGDWGDYGWDNAFDAKGEWTRGPLHGYVYWIRNQGTSGKPNYTRPKKVIAGGKPVDVFGMPSPNFADFDGDEDLDLLCGEFVDGFTYFQNIGTRKEPKYQTGKKLLLGNQPLVMDLCMIVPVAIDWDKDGDVDLVVGQEDGRVALIEHTGNTSDGMPIFKEPKFFQQQAENVMFGALVTPESFDWDGDGDEDLICGNTAGYIGFIENLDGKNPPKWAAPVRLKAEGNTIRIMAGPNGSIQGPCERKWGYTTLSVADWDHDKLPDIVVNSIWGKLIWFRNIGTRNKPKLAKAVPIEVQWKGKAPKPAWNWWSPKGNELVTQWRTTPEVVDWNRDGLNDLVMLDHEGYLAFFQRKRIGKKLVLLPGKRVFQGGTYDRNHRLLSKKTDLLRLNNGTAGKSGRRQLCFVDWDKDGELDLLINSRNANLMRNVLLKDGPWIFEDQGPLGKDRLAGHATHPTTVDWDRDGKRELLVGGEDGFFYYLGKEVNQFKRVNFPRFVIEGRNFEIATLTTGSKAFSNRNYVWMKVPKELQGFKYTRTSGGEPATVAVVAKENSNIRIGTAVSQKGINLKGWEPVKKLRFQYSDRGKTEIQVFERNLEAGERLAIPQGNWSGGLVLIQNETE